METECVCVQVGAALAALLALGGDAVTRRGDVVSSRCIGCACTVTNNLCQKPAACHTGACALAACRTVWLCKLRLLVNAELCGTGNR